MGEKNQRKGRREKLPKKWYEKISQNWKKWKGLLSVQHNEQQKQLQSTLLISEY